MSQLTLFNDDIPQSGVKGVPLHLLVINPPVPESHRHQKSEQLFINKIFPSRIVKVSSPHISLDTCGFTEIPIDMGKQVIKNIVSSIDQFDIHLQGFGSFYENTIFWRVANPDPIKDVNVKILEAIGEECSQIYTPHLTVVRGIKKIYFRRLEPEYKKRLDSWSFTPTHVTLLASLIDPRKTRKQKKLVQITPWKKVGEFPFRPL